MCSIITPTKKAGAGLRAKSPAATNTIRTLNYHQPLCVSKQNHVFYVSQGRHVFERPANWNVRLRR